MIYTQTLHATPGLTWPVKFYHTGLRAAAFLPFCSAACSLDLDFELDHKKQPHSDEIFQLFSLCFSGTGLNHPSQKARVPARCHSRSQPPYSSYCCFCLFLLSRFSGLSQCFLAVVCGWEKTKDNCAAFTPCAAFVKRSFVSSQFWFSIQNTQNGFLI